MIPGSHTSLLKRILRYLRGTVDFGLLESSNLVLVINDTKLLMPCV